MKKIKPLRTFAAGNTIFYTYAKEPYEVEDEQAAAWEKSGHCEIVEELDTTTKEDAAATDDLDVTNKQEAAEIEPKEVEGTNTPENNETAENEQEGPDFEAMNYKELVAAAKAAEIKGYNTMKKPDLIAALKGE